MGYYSSARGEITVTPPFSPEELKANIFNDIWELVPSEDGSSLKPYEDDFKAYYIEQHVSTLIDYFPDHSFEGTIEFFGEDNTDIWRLVLSDRKFLKEEAKTVWPDGTEVRSNF